MTGNMHDKPGKNPMIDSLRDRYPGPRSFGDDEIDRQLFFGRAREIATLTHRVRATRLLVLFGKSGLGKTSLLQAGLFPRLRQDHSMLPITVRLNQADLVAEDAVKVVIGSVQESARSQEVQFEAGVSNSLWEFFKTTDFWRGDTLLVPVLVFDQFEEVFTLQGVEFRQALAAQLKDLAGRGLPEAVRRRRDAGDRTDYGSAAPDLRVVLSFREEYLAALEELVADVPAILENRFRLTPLDRERAENAVVKPAAVANGGIFRTKSFAYAPATLQAMLEFLGNRAGEVEPFQLQVLCSHVERQVAELQAHSKTDEPVSVDEEVLGGRKEMDAVLARFYEAGLNQIKNRRQRGRARRLCQLGLLSPAGNRVSVEESTIQRGYRVSYKSLDSLLGARLVRKDTRPGLGGFYYELSHDSLAGPVLEDFKRSRNRLRRRNMAIAISILVIIVPLVRYLWLEAKDAEQQAKVTTKVAQQVVNGPKYIEPTMIKVSGGRFDMGSPAAEEGRSGNEGPQRKVDVSPFAMGEREVTFDEYDLFAIRTGRRLPYDEGWGRGNLPVINVHWGDAVAYAVWLSGQTRKTYRLPTEAEWEYVARAGTETRYWWGDEIGDNRANCAGCGSSWDARQTAPAKSFLPNDIGLHDTVGNVWEWVQDCYVDNYKDAPVDGSAREEPGCSQQVIRGGSWGNQPKHVRSALRYRENRDTRDNSVGFRLAQDE